MDEHTDEQASEHAQRILSTPGAGDAAAPFGADGDAGLRELALRLLRWPTGAVRGDLQLLPGALPPALPFAVPLPPGTRVVGTFTSRRETRVVLDADLPPERVLASYREQLLPAGWHERPSLLGGQPRGGFLNTVNSPFGQYPERLTRWFAKETWALSVEVAEGSGAGGRAGSGEGSSTGGAGATDVWLTFYADVPTRYEWPRGPRRTHRAHFDLNKLIPPLAPPTGGRQRFMGGGGGIDQWRSSAGLVTELDLAAVAAHYAQQLERGGWTRRGGDEGGGVLAWSAWDVVDEAGEPWRGQLVALRWPQAPGDAAGPQEPRGPEGLGVLREYLLEVRLMWVGGEPNDFLFS